MSVGIGWSVAHWGSICNIQQFIQHSKKGSPAQEYSQAAYAVDTYIRHQDGGTQKEQLP